MITTQPFKLSLSDQGQFFWTWYRQNLFSRANVIRLAVVSVIFFLASISVATGFFSPEIMAIMLAVSLVASVMASAVIIYVILPLIHWLLDLIIFLFRQSGRREYQVTASDDGIVNRIDAMEALVNWSQVRLIKADGPTILLFTGKTSAIIVPRRAFATKEAADSFLNYAETQIEPF